MASNKDRFRSALKKSIKQNMDLFPELFSKIALEDKQYPQKFADHMIEKFEAGRVLALNETVTDALKYVGREGTLLNAYAFLQLEAPGGEVAETDEAPEKAEKKQPKKERTRPAPVNDVGFRGC